MYGVGRQFNDALISNTQDILRDLAQLSQDLSELLKTHFQGSVAKASRMAQRLMLSYHHVGPPPPPFHRIPWNPDIHNPFFWPLFPHND